MLQPPSDVGARQRKEFACYTKHRFHKSQLTPLRQALFTKSVHVGFRQADQVSIQLKITRKKLYFSCIAGTDLHNGVKTAWTKQALN